MFLFFVLCYRCHYVFDCCLTLVQLLTIWNIESWCFFNLCLNLIYQLKTNAFQLEQLCLLRTAVGSWSAFGGSSSWSPSRSTPATWWPSWPRPRWSRPLIRSTNSKIGESVMEFSGVSSEEAPAKTISMWVENDLYWTVMMNMGLSNVGPTDTF